MNEKHLECQWFYVWGTLTDEGNLHNEKGSTVTKSAITPRYADLFNGMIDQIECGRRFDAVLLERYS